MHDTPKDSAQEQPDKPAAQVPETAPTLPPKLKKQLREALANTSHTSAETTPIQRDVTQHSSADPLLLDTGTDAEHAESEPETALDLSHDTTESEDKDEATTGVTDEASRDATEDDIDDTKTDEAVDDILATEADTVLAAEDKAREAIAQPPRTGWRKLAGFFAGWWANKIARWATIFVLLAAIVTVAVVPKTRYFVLNAAGVRSSLTLTALDDTTQLPLKNVVISAGTYQAKTDSKGVATLRNLKLGTYALSVQRLAFAPIHQTVNVGWGSNQLGLFSMHATGMQYTITATDYVSGKGITNAQAADGDATAQADKSGKIILTVSEPPTSGLQVDISAPGYRTEHRTIDAAATAPTTVVLVSNQKEVYVSKQSGTYDMYSLDIDGQNKKMLLAGTGLETGNMQLAISGDGQHAAFVSTRDNTRDADGYLLSTLTLVDIQAGTATTLEHAEQIQLIDWAGSKLVYETVVAGASAANPQRERIFSYDYKANARVQIAGANQFNWVANAAGAIYYAVSSTDPTANIGLYKVNPDNSDRQQLFAKEIWSAFRTDYATFALQSPGAWYAFTLGGHTIAGQAPSQYNSRQYLENAGITRSLWVDNRDGKGVLLVHDDAAGKDAVVVSQDSLAYPVRWLSDDLVVFRVASNQETADYIVSLSGGSAKKMTDVTNVYGFSQGF